MCECVCKRLNSVDSQLRIVCVGAMHSNEVGLAQIRKWESIEYSGNHPTADEREIMVKLMPMLISKKQRWR